MPCLGNVRKIKKGLMNQPYVKIQSWAVLLYSFLKTHDFYVSRNDLMKWKSCDLRGSEPLISKPHRETYSISNLKYFIQTKTHHDTSEWKLTALFGLEQFVTFSSKTQIIRSPVKRVTFEVLAASGSLLIQLQFFASSKEGYLFLLTDRLIKSAIK